MASRYGRYDLFQHLTFSINVEYVYCGCLSFGVFSKTSGGDWYIEDESGKQLPALIVFSESLKYLKQSLLEEAKNNKLI